MLLLQYMFLAWNWLKLKLRAFLTDENGDTNIVSMVVLIGIAVVLAVIFRKAIAKLIKDLLDQIGITASSAVAPEAE